MVASMILLTIVVFVVVDILSRTALKRYEEKKQRQKREKALDIGLRLDYTDEAKSLKRVEVDEPRARILAVDDEAIVLDSFRKILVIEGYSIDTVETGQEALGLIRKHDYDFVFTDLKMPEMDGLDVTKAVKHLRPDIDVIIITGFATIESAVAGMKYGAMDYVQKPFTAEELVEFVGTSLIRRQARIEQETRPRLHLVTPSTDVSPSRHTFNVPSGAYIAPTHTWVSLSLDGMLLVGIDDFALKLIERIDGVELPEADRTVRKGDPLFTVRHGGHRITFPSPVSGRVAGVNERVEDNPELITLKPYDLGGLCWIEPSDLAAELKTLRIGTEAVAWYQQEIDKYFAAMQTVRSERNGGPPAHQSDDRDRLEDERWEAFSRAFLAH